MILPADDICKLCKHETESAYSTSCMHCIVIAENHFEKKEGIMPSPDPADKEEYAFWCREKAAADTEKMRKHDKN